MYILPNISIWFHKFLIFWQSSSRGTKIKYHNLTYVLHT
jgi:hypothetical protein